MTLLQALGRGQNRVGELISREDIPWGHSPEIPTRLELQLSLQGQKILYSLAFELPARFHEHRICQERLIANGVEIYNREVAQVQLQRSGAASSRFSVDWHTVALNVIQDSGDISDPLKLLKHWLKTLVCLAPLPSRITGESKRANLMPEASGENLGEWVTGLLTQYPASYTELDRYVRSVLPDFEALTNPESGRDTHAMEVKFRGLSQSVPFAQLSDGEKCQILCGVLLAAGKAYGPILCFWDEPESHIGLDNLSEMMSELRNHFQGQLWATSHSPRAIESFPTDSVYYLEKKSILESASLRPISEMDYGKSLVTALARGELDGL